jgi:hypothetical protein
VVGGELGDDDDVGELIGIDRAVLIMKPIILNLMNYYGKDSEILPLVILSPPGHFASDGIRVNRGDYYTLM